MNGIFKNTLFRLNAITLICFPSCVLAESPWKVTDGSTLNVTSNYTAETQGDYPLYAAGAGSHLVINPGLSFGSKQTGLDVAQGIDGAVLELNNNTIVANNNNSRGIYLSDSQLTMTGGSIITLGESSPALEAVAGSVVSLDNVQLNSNSSGLTDTLIINGSTLEADSILIQSDGTGTGMRITGNSDVTLNDTEVSMTGMNSIAAVYVDQGKVNADSLRIFATGSYGLQAKGLNETTAPDITLNQGQITVTNGVGVDVENSHITLNNTRVSTLGTAEDAHALNMKGNAQAEITGGQYETKGEASHAITLQDSSASLTASGVKLYTYGANAYGLDVADGQAELSNGQIKTYGKYGHGIVSHADDVRIDSSSVNTMGESAIAAAATGGGAIQIADSNFTTLGEAAYGLAVNTHSNITADNLNVMASGTYAHGLYLEGGELNLLNSSVNVQGSSASAIYANGDALTGLSQVTVDNGSLTTAGFTGIIANGADLSVTLKNGTELTAGDGLLALSTSRVSGAVYYSNIDLAADNNVTLNGDVRAEMYSTLNLSLRNQSVWNGAAYRATDVMVDNSSRWNISGNSDVANLDNAGTVEFTPKEGEQSVLTVRQNYTGNGGTLVFNTVLGDENSETNKMVVEGDTAGTTNVVVNNLGGKGDYTQGNGIELIRVAGNSAGEFVQQGRIVAGAYDYSLLRGEGAAQPNWYLSNKKPDEPDDEVEGPADINDPGDNGNGGNPGDNGDGGDPADNGPHLDEIVADVPPTGGPVTPPGPAVNDRNLALRPESGVYLANFEAANNLFVTRLHDRLGETQFTDNLSDQGHATSLWLRQVGGQNTGYNSNGQLKMVSNRYVAQLGGDLVSWSQNQLDRFHLGVMAGYAHSKNKTRSSAYGYRAGGEINGYSAGIYGTWYANDQDKTGTYVDSWVLYNWFKNSVNGQDLPEENYRSKGLTASVEAGYTAKLSEFRGSMGSVNQWFIQPKAQVVWQGVRADDHRETNGTHVQAQGNDNVMTSLGVRTFLKGSHIKDANTPRQFEPFVEVNWIHNTETPAVRMDNTLIQQAGVRNLGEVKVGIEARLDTNFKGWTNFAQKVGDAGYNDSQFMLGINYHF